MFFHSPDHVWSRSPMIQSRLHWTEWKPLAQLGPTFALTNPMCCWASCTFFISSAAIGRVQTPPIWCLLAYSLLPQVTAGLSLKSWINRRLYPDNHLALYVPCNLTIPYGTLEICQENGCKLSRFQYLGGYTKRVVNSRPVWEISETLSQKEKKFLPNISKPDYMVVHTFKPNTGISRPLRVAWSYSKFQASQGFIGRRSLAKPIVKITSPLKMIYLLQKL